MMRILIKISVIFFVHILMYVRCDERFITIFTPKIVHEGSPYSLLVQPTNLGSNTKAAFQFRNEKVIANLQNGQHTKVNFQNTRLIGGKSGFNFSVTLYDSDTCYAKDAEVKAAQRTFYSFIQTDKPAYKPGDEVKFRVLVVDQDLKPLQMNNIEVSVVDPLDRVIQTFEDLSGQDVGVFEEKFEVASDTVLGNWKIKVVVDKKEEQAESKSFSVSKYTLPLFEVDISTSDKNILRNSEVTFSFHAKYSFGQFVTGNAELNVKNIQNGRVYLNEKFSNVQDVQRVTYNVLRDLKIEQLDLLELEAMVTFVEPESKVSFNKSTTFQVHNEPKYKLIAIHPEKFTPGSKLGLKVKVNDWKDKSVLETTSKLQLKYWYTLNSGSDSAKSVEIAVENGIVSHEFTTPINAKELNIEFKFMNSQLYRKTIGVGAITTGSDALVVEHYPKSPKLNDNIKIYVKGVSYMQSILAVTMTKHGIVDSKTVQCNNQNCQFDLRITQNMMPHSTLTVFYIKDSQHIYRGSTKIVSNELGIYDLKFSMAKAQAKPKEDIQMKFVAPKKSKVYLLAYDKRLKSLGDGNDIKHEDVIEKVGSYENKFKILIINKSMFRECADEEYSLLGVTNWRRIEEERRRAEAIEAERRRAEAQRFREENERRVEAQRSSGGGFRTLSFSSAVSYDRAEAYVPPTPTYSTPIYRSLAKSSLGPDQEPIEIEDKESEESLAESIDVLRDKFQETWIFDSVDIGNEGSAMKTFKTPDSITNWKISAFSVNKRDGISMASPLELTVKNEFFIKMNLPYSIRHQEVLRLDILVYNYVESKELLNTKIELENSGQFQIVEFSQVNGKCSKSYSNSQTSEKSSTVPHMSIKRFSFHIRSNPTENNFGANFIKKLKLQVRATGTDKNGKTYRDLVQKDLLVEPVGIKSFHVFADAHMLNGGSSNPNTYTMNAGNDFGKVNVIISGDYLTDTLEMDARFGQAPSNGLIHKTSKLKKHAEYFRYLKLKGTENPPKKHIVHFYQSLLQERLSNWSYSNSTTYRAHFIDTLASAMEIGAIPPHRLLVRSELDFLRTQQKIDGDFEKAGSFSMLKQDVNRPNTVKYFETAYSIIPMIKHQNFMGSDLSVYIVMDLGDYYLIIKSEPDYNANINKAFDFLSANKRNVDNDGLSIAAYAHALNGSTSQATQLLREFENDLMDKGNNRKCLKINKSQSKCDMQHTAYTALTYMELNSIEKAKPLVNWLINELNKNYFESYTHEYVLAMEAVAKFAKHLKNDQLDLTFNLKNERNFQKTVKLTKSNSQKPQDIEFPEYSQSVISTVNGRGFGSVSTIFEQIVKLPKLSTEFSLSIGTSGSDKLRNVKVCGKYTKSGGSDLSNVIFEVEIPTGYAYAGIADSEEKMKDIKLIEEKRSGSLIFFYFDEFMPAVNYCIDIKATKVFEVTQTSQAGVKVYDFNKKENVAISFYKFTSDECSV